MHGIRSKLIGFALLATLVPSVALGVLSFWRYQAVLNENVRHELRMLDADANGELKSWLSERVAELRTVATADLLGDGLAPGTNAVRPPGHVGPRELALYLRGVKGRLEAFQEFTLADGEGRFVAGSAAVQEPFAVPTTWPATAITAGVILAQPRWHAARDAAVLALAVPVLSARNEVLGSLVAVVDLASFRPRLTTIARAAPAELALFTTGGEPLLESRAPGGARAPLAPEVVARLAAPPGEAITFRDRDGRELIGVAEASRHLEVIVLAQRDRAEVFAAWLTLLEVYLALVAALTLVVATVAYAMGRSIVAPLYRLIGATDRIAQGHLDVALPGNPEGEIGRLTRVFNMMVERLRASRAAIESAGHALEAKNRQLEVLAASDGLTGLCNRAKLDEILADEFLRFRRSGRPFAVLMLDLDNFKAINDNLGHAAGDRVLQRVAALLGKSIRAVDHVARYGGEEFVVLLVDTPLGAALEVAERIRAIVEAPVCDAKETTAVTVSVGVTHSRDDDADTAQMLARADRALYAAKGAGRNQVQFAT